MLSNLKTLIIRVFRCSRSFSLAAYLTRTMTHARLILQQIWCVAGERHSPCRDKHSQLSGHAAYPWLSTGHLCCAEAVSTCEHISFCTSWSKLLLCFLNIAHLLHIGIKCANRKKPLLLHQLFLPSLLTCQNNERSIPNCPLF